ncbi:MAG: ABC transporter ATP-binding protein/permease [Candidatus Pacebacteria bacterium]|nr:ABC transporter ATP-binding protein/permease [Candidatus Paceibacterota bacterium]
MNFLLSKLFFKKTDVRLRWAWYMKYFKDMLGKLSLSIGLILLQTFSLIPIAAIFKYVFDVILPSKDVRGLITSLGGILVLFTLNAIALAWNRYLVLSIVKTTTKKIRLTLITKVIHQHRSFYTEADIDELHSRLVQDSERIDFMTNSLLTQFIPGSLIVFGMFCFLIFLNPLLFLVAMVFLPLMFPIGHYIGAISQKRTRIFHDDFVAFSRGISKFLKLNDHIHVSGATTYELTKQEQLIEQLRHSSHAMSWINTVQNLLNQNLLMLTGIVSLLVGGIQVIHGSGTLGELLAFYAALMLLSNNARNALGSLPVLIEGYESLYTLYPLMKSVEFDKKGNKIVDISTSIIFKQVCFGYGDTFMLKDINLEIQRGKSIGIYGGSGSGKSTLIHLMMGLYEPMQGEIQADGIDLREIDMHTYRKHIGVLLQDPTMFHGTIRENLLYGLDNISEEDIVDACILCEAHTFITSLSHGYDTQIGERGVKLSGGQRQRIALARTLLCRPKIVVLDEPNNHLSLETTERILKNVHVRGLTIVVVTHDKRLIPCLDYVYECIPFHNSEKQITIRKIV